MPDRMVSVVAITGGGEAFGEIARQVDHFAETVADRGTRVIGTKRGLPFERAQQLLSDRMVVSDGPTRAGKPHPAPRLACESCSANRPPASPPKSTKLSPPPPFVP